MPRGARTVRGSAVETGAAGVVVVVMRRILLGRVQSTVMERLPTQIRDVVAELRQGLQSLYGKRFRDLLLYGSYARGEADEGSDVDLLLLLEGPVETVKEIVRVQPVKWPLSLAADLVLSVMPVSVEAYQKAETSFIRNVRKDAVKAA